jgi:ATP-dependent RNA helicase RhlB
MAQMSDDSHLSEIRFADLGLVPSLMEGVDAAGFRFCTGIQAQALPIALAGKDVAGQAQTGTGKTAAFLLAAMQYLLTAPPAAKYIPGAPRALMVAPTRELAVQIARDAESLGRFTGLRVVVVYGGAGYEEQRAQVRAGVDILIGTPGRLIDYFRQQVYSLDSVQVLVLDEADRMFDLGFIKDIRFLLRRLPKPDMRLNMLFSATLSYRVTELAYEHMNGPQMVNVDPDKVTADRVTQVLYHVSSEEKVRVLLGLLRRMDPTRTLLFINTKRTADRIRDYLVGNGYDAEVLSGDVPQRNRLKLLNRFQAGELPILVATDVAARGLHIPDVSHVFNFDLPQDAQDYVHRIGRTARAGASGNAISLACEQYVFSLGEIEAYIGRRIPVSQVTEDLLVPVAPPVRSERRPRLASRSDGRRPRADGSREDRSQRPRRPSVPKAPKAMQEVEPTPALTTATEPSPGATVAKRRRRRRRSGPVTQSS